MSDLVGNPNCWFSHAQAVITLDYYLPVYLAWYCFISKKHLYHLSSYIHVRGLKTKVQSKALTTPCIHHALGDLEFSCRLFPRIILFRVYKDFTSSDWYLNLCCNSDDLPHFKTTEYEGGVTEVLYISFKECGSKSYLSVVTFLELNRNETMKPTV